MWIRPLAAAVVGAAVLALAGCGSDGPTAVDAGSAPGSTSTSPSPDAPTSNINIPGSDAQAADPTWPSTGCATKATSAIDYGREPHGWRTPEEAVQHAGNLGLPAGTLVLAKTKAHEPMAVYVVDDTGTIRAAVTVFLGSTGFYVDGVTTCA